jgi:hypothetical protein
MSSCSKKNVTVSHALVLPISRLFHSFQITANDSDGSVHVAHLHEPATARCDPDGPFTEGKPGTNVSNVFQQFHG